ncbi:MAG: DUF2157 domain-containing protein [Leptonema sp. (in: Bacteria)]|nr:DUF2157 domain-containing protein [Leptonema sp. (in: bacteria)]
MKINSRLEKWQQAGLISADQSARILQYEKENQPQYAYYGFMGLGAIAIAIGIISLIAFNWNNISDAAKLSLDFVLLCATGAGIYVTEKNSKPIIAQILVIVFLGLILGSIGLISQIFHTGGELHQALFLFSVLSLPLILILPGRLAIHIWYLLFVTAAFSYWNDHIPTVLAVLPAGFLSISLGLANTKQFELHSKTASIWAAVFYGVGTIIVSTSIFDYNQPDNRWLSILHLLALFVPMLLSFLYFKKLSKSVVFLSIALLIYTLFLWPGFVKSSSDFIIALMFVVVWLFFGLSIEHRRLFEVCLIGMGIRFLVVYFQILGDLALTGFGLIASGILILVSVWLYTKFRESFIKGISQWI